MTEQERRYRGVAGAIGKTMLIFLGLFWVFQIGYVLVDSFLYNLPISDKAYFITTQLVYAACYMLSFMLPVVFLKLFLKRHGGARPMYVDPPRSPYLPLMIVAGIAIAYAMSTVNHTLSGVFDLLVPPQDTENMIVVYTQSSYQLVLNFIVIAVVPAVCEEFLFRGAILTNCLPFGRSNAILISSLMFAMMHQNFDQILYTFVGGVIMGLIYERTGSIWSSMLMHLINNFFSVIASAVTSHVGAGVYGSLIMMLIEICIFAVGTLATVILICRFCSAERDFSGGVFGKDFSATDAYAPYPIDGKRARKLFATPTVIVFMSLALASMLLRVLAGG